MKITNNILNPYYKKAFNLVYLQLGMMLLLAIAWLLGKDLRASGSALLGGVSWLIPSWYFIRKIFRHKKDRSINIIAKDLFIGELLKFFFSAVLIILCLKFFPVNLLAFLTGYIGVVTMAMFMPMVFEAKNTN